ncbi:dNA-binding domain-containing protein AraC-type [Alistipes sp. CAG:831]|nr:dNA-binding domain-containing protein AraC-type [Alistipes sp. CAG:831]
MSGIRTFSIEELNRQMRQPTLHPQVAVIDPSRLGEDTALCFTGNYYAVRFVRIQCGEPCPYGRQSADFQYATLAFTEPGDIVDVSREDAAGGDISGILFHPDLFCSKSLVLKKADYTFFGYRDN